ncbi:prion-inhibition and propagation-domain-containing protein [Sordaria brevicollis]|uniref:Prion-inhibition and propagation-domain-containing protein n=1 Tax=Sordaria brevicollis TaxID=83679 RepID=A0AAE0PMJ6_SORBR|nr:prion-inhibition and propagation-domain-containing protein [Sordaria brevicollis]
MDPLSALELTQVVFDNTVRLFKFLSALVDFPQECEKYRLQLIIEYNRVLAWAKAVGLIDPLLSSSPSTTSSYGSSDEKKKNEEADERKRIAALASALNTNSTELILILSRIQWLLAEFRELNERYGNELIPDEVVGVKPQQSSTSQQEKGGKKDEGKGNESPKKPWKPLERRPKDTNRTVTGHAEEEKSLKKSTSSPDTTKSAQTKSVPQLKTEESLLKISSLAVSYDQSTKSSLLSPLPKQADSHRKGTNHIRRFLAHTKDVITHPVRVRWVMVDQEAFEALLLDLHSLTERLHELMRNSHQEKMDEIVAKTYREMILARDGIGELQDMVAALGKMLVVGDKSDDDDDGLTDDEGGMFRVPREKQRGRRLVNEVRDLVRLKRMAKVSEQMLRTLNDSTKGDRLETEFGTEITVTRYGDPNKEGHVDFSEVFQLAEPDGVDPSRISRPRGYLTVEDPDSLSGEDEISVWIEWKAMGDYPEGSIKERESYLRTLTLAQMLRLPKPASLHVPECIGFLDDRDVFGTERYGLVFKYSGGTIWDSTELVSLYDLLGIDAYKPSISQRLDLALKLCSTVLNLHAVNWLHKGVLSANVLLPLDSPSMYDEPGENDMRRLMRYSYWRELREPLLSGFEYSRPENSQTTARSLDTAWDLYRWPSIQREHPTEQNWRKTYDLYSLGLMLLEIGHWQPLHEILHLSVRSPEVKREEEVCVLERGEVKRREKPSVPLHQSKEVREWLLGTYIGPSAPCIEAGKLNPVEDLRNTMGDRYRRAVERCLWAHGPNGFGVEDVPDQSTDSEVGIRLQEAFTKYVIEELEAVRV